MKDYKMNIRSDFQPLPFELKRFLEFANIFETNNRERWSHLKNQEDFRDVYLLDYADKEPLERIYSIGRDLAVAMADRLRWFNYPDYCPSLTSYLNEPVFRTGWVAQLPKLYEISRLAKEKMEELGGKTPWAIGQMVQLFDEQLKLLEEVARCVISLKSSELYRKEQGVLSIQPYIQILNAINRVGKTFERLPATYQDKDEESLRDHILLALSTNHEFTTLGEVFNKNGKTDILSSRHGHTEFIGECKFWHGEKAFLETINQILGYATWRNDKLAIIMFVGNLNIKQIIDKAIHSIQSHPCYSLFIDKSDETWFNYKFEKDGAEFELAVMFYHIPKT